MRNEKEIQEAKRVLYHLILESEVGETTENEINIAFYLAQDKQIQEILKERMK